MSPHIYSDEHDLVICELVDPNPAVMPKPARRNSSSSSAAASSPPAAPLGDTTAAHNNNNNNSNTAGSLAGMLEQFDAAAHAAQEEAAAVLRGILAYMNTLLLSNGSCACLKRVCSSRDFVACVIHIRCVFSLHCFLVFHLLGTRM